MQSAMLASPTGMQARCQRQAFQSGPGQKRGCRLHCFSSAGSNETEPRLADRRSIVMTSLTAGLLSSILLPRSVGAESACSDFAVAANGIKWCDTKEGSGKTPAKGTMIRCHYTGRLTSNGQVFDSSYERRRPLTFKVGAREVIQGWDKSILGEDDLPPMKEGGKRRVVVPPELGYGARGAGGVIPPNASLTFDIELLGKR